MSKAKKPAAKTPKVTKPVVYVVMRTGFEAYYYLNRLPDYSPATGSNLDVVAEVPVRGFARMDDATAYARQLDAEVRATFPPPPLCGMDRRNDQAGMRAVVAKVAAFGLPPIKFGRKPVSVTFGEWWAENVSKMSAEQKVALWEPFAGMTFHHVKEVELEG